MVFPLYNMAPNRGEDDVERYGLYPCSYLCTVDPHADQFVSSLSRHTNEYPSSSMIEHARRPSEAYVNLHANVEAKYARSKYCLVIVQY